MMKTKVIFALILASSGLSGCVGGGGGSSVPENRGLDSIHQPVVSRADFVFDIPAEGGAVYPADASRLSSWMDALKVGYGDRLSIDTNGLYDTANLRQLVNTLAARKGLLVDLAAPVTAGEIAPGSARVVVSRMQARVDGCPDWRRTDGYDPKGNVSSNFGCATNRNLSAMIADPADLVSGKTTEDPAAASYKSGAAQGNRNQTGSSAAGAAGGTSSSGSTKKSGGN